MVAVSTIAGEYGNAWRGIWVGVSWGLGHTTPLLAVGVLFLLLKEAVLARYEAVAPVLEFGVGIMLVVLGAQVFFNLRRGRLLPACGRVRSVPPAGSPARAPTIQVPGGSRCSRPQATA